MFLNKYVNETYLNLIYTNYDEEYLNSLDENNFNQVYLLLKKCNFNFISDIILNYLQIFEMNVEDVYIGIKKLKDKLGDNYVYQIGNNMSYLAEILDNN